MLVDWLLGWFVSSLLDAYLIDKNVMRQLVVGLFQGDDASFSRKSFSSNVMVSFSPVTRVFFFSFRIATNCKPLNAKDMTLLVSVTMLSGLRVIANSSKSGKSRYWSQQTLQKSPAACSLDP